MQVLCGLQVLFLLFNCQTPEIPENAGRQKYMDGVAGRAWTGMMDEVPLHKDSKLFRPYSGIKSTGIRSFFDSVFVKKEEGLYNENIIYEWGKL